MRLSALLTLTLFLTPTFYVVKYYSLDLPREKALAQSASRWQADPGNPDCLLAEEKSARQSSSKSRASNKLLRVPAVLAIGAALRQPGVSWRRPMECLSAKATLAELAAKDPDMAVRTAATQELEKVARGGATLHR